MREVTMPPNDGSPFPCTKMITVPPPFFKDECRKPAIAAYLNEFNSYEYRCALHKGD